MSSSFGADLGNVMGLTQVNTNKVADKSTDKKAGQALDMTDFLTLMVATLKNQTMDNTADTSQMMDQMVQMSVMTAVTNLTNLLTESTALTYAASLVGKEVTIGQYVNGELEEMVRTITGTGTLGGKQVVFTKNPETDEDESYYLTDVMAVGRLPEKTEAVDPNAGSGEEEAEEASYQDRSRSNSASFSSDTGSATASRAAASKVASSGAGGVFGNTPSATRPVGSSTGRGTSAYAGTSQVTDANFDTLNTQKYNEAAVPSSFDVSAYRAGMERARQAQQAAVEAQTKETAQTESQEQQAQEAAQTSANAQIEAQMLAQAKAQAELQAQVQAQTEAQAIAQAQQIVQGVADVVDVFGKVS